MSKLLWLDLETTGLDPDKDLVLEVALVVTDDNLNPLGVEYQSVVQQPMDAVMDRLGGNDYVYKMHTANGLLDELEKGHSPERVALDLHILCRRGAMYRGASRYPTLLAGASIHFDRSFLRRFAPAVDEGLHHRHFDVSVLRHAVNRWKTGRTDWPMNDNHRAMGDVRDSIEQARVAMEVIRGE